MPRRYRYSILFGALGLIVCGAGYAWLGPEEARPVAQATARENSPSGVATSHDEQLVDSMRLPEEPTSPEDLTGEQIQQTVVGHWTSDYYGSRYLTIRSDGTATVLFQANTLARMFVGHRLKIDYTWYYDVSAGQVVFTVAGGAPPQGIEYVVKLWGNQQRQNVLSVCRSQLHLQDLDGKTEHVWKQLGAIPMEIASKFEKL